MVSTFCLLFALVVYVYTTRNHEQFNGITHTTQITRRYIYILFLIRRVDDTNEPLIFEL